MLSAFQLPHAPDNTRLHVLSLVTRVAKCHSVGHVKSPLWILRKVFNMVRSEIPAFRVAAVLACVPVASKHSIAPMSVFGSPTIIECALCLTVFVVRMVGAALYLGRGTPPFAHFGFVFLASGHSALFAHSTLEGCSNPGAGLLGVVMTLERGYPTLPALLDLHPATIQPVPCKGAQGLWSLPADADAAVTLAISRALSAAPKQA